MLVHTRTIAHHLRLLALIFATGIILAGCGPSAHQSAVQSSPYDRAKDAFKSGDLGTALDVTDKLAIATPPVEYTERSRMLRAVIYTGQMKSAKLLAEAYGKGAEKSKNPQFKAEYLRLRNDNLQVAGKAALNVAETAHQIVPNGEIARQLTLEASFPTTEGPPRVAQLGRVEEGGWLEPDQQESAAADALRKGVDDALADAVSGDRAKARQALEGGSTKLDGTASAIFLARELADGAVVFDRHHGRDAQKLLAVCDEGELTLKAALALLKQMPNKDQEKAARKLQDKFQELRRDK